MTQIRSSYSGELLGAALALCVSCGSGGPDVKSPSAIAAAGSAGNTLAAAGSAGNALPASGAAGSAIAGGGSAGSPVAAGGSAGNTLAASGSAGTVVTDVKVTVSPSVVHSAPSVTARFAAMVVGTPDTTVAWSVQEGSAGGSIDATGTYTAPAKTGTFHILATSKAKASAVGSAIAIVGTPGACAGLSKPGVWDSIGPANSQGTGFVAVDPFDPATVWAVAGGPAAKGGTRGIYKSPDCGATWAHVNTGMNGTVLDTATNWSVAFDPVVQGTMYLVGAYGATGLWKSTNGGVDFRQLFTPDTPLAKIAIQNFVNNVSMDPHDHLHLVVMIHGGCTGYEKDCEAESKDGGMSWNITSTPLAWGEGGGVLLLNATSWLWGGSEGGTGTWLTTDNAKSWTEVNKACANGEFSTHPTVPASDGAYYLSSLNGVLRSSNGSTWSVISKDRVVGFTFGDGKLYASDQWTPLMRVAAISDPNTWSTLPPPSGLSANSGCPYLDYDTAHHVLYASCFDGGLWRTATAAGN